MPKILMKLTKAVTIVLIFIYNPFVLLAQTSKATNNTATTSNTTPVSNAVSNEIPNEIPSEIVVLLQDFQSGMIYYNNAKYYDAIKVFQNILTQSDKATNKTTNKATTQDTNLMINTLMINTMVNTYVALIESHIKVKEYQKASTRAVELVTKYPSNKSLGMFLKQKALFFEGKYKDSMDVGYEFLKVEFEATPYFKDAVYFYIAESLLVLKDYMQALIVYNTILKLFPNSEYLTTVQIRANFIDGLDEKDKMLKIINKTRQENIELIKKLNEQ